MYREASLLLISEEPEDWSGLVREARRAGFDVLARQGTNQPPRPASDYDIVAYDWSQGLPVDCGRKVEDFLANPERTASVMALVHPPTAGTRCALFSRLDDLVFPPYEPSEVVARLFRLSERKKDNCNVITAGALSVDLAGHEVTVDGERVLLTHTEFLVLTCLLSRRGRVVTREELGRAVWGGDVALNAEALDVHVRRMRGKLRAAGANPVETVRKVGYRYASEPRSQEMKP